MAILYFQVFCFLNNLVPKSLEIIFVESFAIMHHFKENKKKNLAKFFAQLLYSDTISWTIFSTIRLTRRETTSSAEIFLLNMFNDLILLMGRDRLKERILNP